jgi:hypothetical protein
VPLLDPRWLLPAAPPILLNLAATHGYQQEIRYQYLATAAPFLALAAIAGLRVAGRRRVVLASLLAALVAVAGFIDYRVGPAPWSKDFPRPAEDGPVNQTRRQALGLIDPAAPVSAQYNLAPHLAHRTTSMSFPTRSRLRTGGFRVTGTSRRRSSGSAMWWSSAPSSARPTRPCWTSSAVSPQWRTVLDRQGIVVLERRPP